jgi:hypothetical protein
LFKAIASVRAPAAIAEAADIIAVLDACVIRVGSGVAVWMNVRSNFVVREEDEGRGKRMWMC